MISGAGNGPRPVQGTDRFSGDSRRLFNHLPKPAAKILGLKNGIFTNLAP